ncbi:MAG: CsbD family protein [Clostridiaceae bacterium]
MADLKDKIKNRKDKVVGETKEAVGKATDNEELELKGKIQSTKADIGKKVNDKKEEVTRKINKKIDENDDEE